MHDLNMIWYYIRSTRKCISFINIQSKTTKKENNGDDDEEEIFQFEIPLANNTKYLIPLNESCNTLQQLKCDVVCALKSKI